MLVRFTKNAPSAKADTLTCIRADGTSTTGLMPKQGVLPHDAIHYVVENTLGWREAFFGQIEAGDDFAAVTTRFHGQKTAAVKHPRVRQSEALVECLQAEQWGGASKPAAFTEKLTTACHAHRVAALVLTATDLDRVRVALREFGAAWRPLATGKSLERTF